MGGSAEQAPTTPDSIRASDAERDEAISELGDQYAAGRLSHETFMHRMDEAYEARSRRQLDRLLTDLPRRKAARTLASLRDGFRRQAQSGLDSLGRAGATARTGRPARPQPAPVPGPATPLYFPPGGRTSGQRYTIGREPQCDLLLTHTSVSRHHARLEHRGGPTPDLVRERILVRDLSLGALAT